MKGKTFLILLLVAGLLVVFALLRSGDEKNTAEVKMGAKLFSELPVNAVASVTIADADNKVTLVKGDKVWQVAERSGYAANFDELRDTIVKLSRLKIGRSFAGSPESLARLSLNPPSASDASASGKQITLKDQADKILADITLGQLRESDSGGGGGQYLKKADDDTVFLVDGNFQFLKTAPAEWLNREILDIKADNVASVTGFRDDASTPVYTLSRPKQGEAAQLTPVPQGRTADAAKIDQVFEALAPLTMEDVKTASGKSLMAEANQTRLVYRLFDGRRITLFPQSNAEENYTIRVLAAEGPAAEAAEPTSEDSTSDEAEAVKSDTESAKSDSEAPAVKTAQQLNEALSPWIFSIKQWQFNSFITQLEALLEEVKKDEDGTS